MLLEKSVILHNKIPLKKKKKQLLTYLRISLVLPHLFCMGTFLNHHCIWSGSQVAAASSCVFSEWSVSPSLTVSLCLSSLGSLLSLLVADSLSFFPTVSWLTFVSLSTLFFWLFPGWRGEHSNFWTPYMDLHIYRYAYTNPWPTHNHTCTHTAKPIFWLTHHTHVFCYIVGDWSRVTKSLFLIATTPRCRRGRYSFLWIVPLYPWSIPCNTEC